MANPRALDRRRKSIRNIRKITRTMELIATARFKKAMNRATAARAYTERISAMVADLARSGMELRHPLLERREDARRGVLLVLSSNRGLCGGYNAGVMRQALPRYEELGSEGVQLRLEVSGRRGISAFRFRKITVDEAYTDFDDDPTFEAVGRLAERYLESYARRELDRLDVAYTRFVSSARQQAVIETLLPLESLIGEEEEEKRAAEYDLLPDAESIVRELVPASFKLKLFKCFLDAAVSEQIARMVAMKSATENATEMIQTLSRQYNRARQSRITSEISEIIGGVEALNT